MQRRATISWPAIAVPGAGVPGKYRWVLIDQRKCAAQDRRCGSPVLLEDNEAGRGKVTVKQLESGAGGSAEAIDCPVGIADRKDVSFGAGQAGKNLYLREVRILKFVCEDEAGPGASFRENLVIVLQKVVRPRDHVAERAEIVFRQPALHRGKNARDLAASSQRLRLIQHSFRFRDTRNG